MGQFDVDFDTLCVHVAKHKQEELKVEEKHPHHRPTKRMANLLLLHLVMYGTS
jgi:hypothetical protein